MISDSDVASIRSIDVGCQGGTTSNAYSTEHEAEVVVNLRRSISSLQLDYTHLIDVYRHQVAGHTDHYMLRFMERFILKPILKEHLFQREKSFYEHVTRCCCCNDDNITNIERVNQHCDNYIGNEARNHLVTPSLLSYLPKYFQSVTTSFRLSSSQLSSSSSSSSSTIKEEIDELSYLVLEDISHSYSRDHLSIIDIKMGTQTYEPTASIEKIIKETSKFIHQRQLGFRISGMKVFNHRTKQYLIKDKFFGRSLEPSTVMYGLGLFFYNGYTLCKEIISDVIQQLNGLLVIMNEQVDYKFYCTSLLIVYNACPDKATTTTTSISTIMSNTSISNIISSPETMKLMGSSPSSASSSPSLSSSSCIRSIHEEICDLIDARLLLMNSKLQLTASMRHFLLYGSCHSTSNAVTVKLVDFAHVIINDECDRRKDEEFIHGLMNLIKSLKELLSKLDCSNDEEEENTVRIILSLFQ